MLDPLTSKLRIQENIQRIQKTSMVQENIARTQNTSIAATAASRQINDISAPVQPSVRQASTFMLTSELHGILRKWMRNMSSLSFSFGGPTYSSRSKRPVLIFYEL